MVKNESLTEGSKRFAEHYGHRPVFAHTSGWEKGIYRKQSWL